MFRSYYYGGLPPYDEQGYGYGDVWILSLPSFTWTQVSERYRIDRNEADVSSVVPFIQ